MKDDGEFNAIEIDKQGKISKKEIRFVLKSEKKSCNHREDWRMKLIQSQVRTILLVEVVYFDLKM